MATLTTLTAAPAICYAGDTLLFEIALADYSASDGWTLSIYYRKKDGSAIDLTSTDGTNGAHLFSIPATDTAGYIPGDYVGQGVVSDGTNSRTVFDTRLTVNPALSQQGVDYDGRSHAEKCLDAIDAVMEGRATKDILNTTIAGQSIARMTPEQLIIFRNYYRAEVDNERAAQDAANGNSTGRNILVRFN